MTAPIGYGGLGKHGSFETLSRCAALMFVEVKAAGLLIH